MFAIYINRPPVHNSRPYCCTLKITIYSTHRRCRSIRSRDFGTVRGMPKWKLLNCRCRCRALRTPRTENARNGKIFRGVDNAPIGRDEKRGSDTLTTSNSFTDDRNSWTVKKRYGKCYGKRRKTTIDDRLTNLRIVIIETRLHGPERFVNFNDARGGRTQVRRERRTKKKKK